MLLVWWKNSESCVKVTAGQVMCYLQLKTVLTVLPTILMGPLLRGYLWNSFGSVIWFLDIFFRISPLVLCPFFGWIRRKYGDILFGKEKTQWDHEHFIPYLTFFNKKRDYYDYHSCNPLPNWPSTLQFTEVSPHLIYKICVARDQSWNK